MSLEFDVKNIRNLTHAFWDKAPFEVIHRVFNQFPQSELNSFDSLQLRNLVAELDEREDVKILRDSIATEITQHGREGLDRMVDIVGMSLPVNSFKLNQANVEREEMDEVAGICNACNEGFVTGNIEHGRPLEKISFKPENIFYAKNLQGMFQKGTLIHPNCIGSDISYRNIAQLTIYRQKNSGIAELTERVNNIIQETADEMMRNSRSNKQDRRLRMQGYLVDNLGKVFNKIGIGNNVNYAELYNVFEWIFRQNINLDQFGFNDKLKQSLRGSIARHIVPIHGLVRSRVKSLERIYEKGLEVLYDMRNPQDKERDRGKARSLQDVYALRIMVNGREDCYKIFRFINHMNGFEVIDIDDSISNPRTRENGPPYMSMDLKVTDGVATYDVQVRTHEMDRIIRTSPNLAHDEVYKLEKLGRLNHIPLPTRIVFASLIGLPVSRITTYE